MLNSIDAHLKEPIVNDADTLHILVTISTADPTSTSSSGQHGALIFSTFNAYKNQQITVNQTVKPKQ